MAYTLNQLRAVRKTSVHGRRLGLDANDFIVGPIGMRLPIDDVSGLGSAAVASGAATGTSVPYYGITRVVSSAGSTANTGFAYTLQAPPGPGVRKDFFYYGASTSAHVFGMGGSAVVQGGSLTSAGSTMFSMWRQNSQISLVSLTSAQWLMLNNLSSANASSDAFGISFTATASS